MNQPVLEVTDLVTVFEPRGSLLRKAGGPVRAVDGVSLRLARGEMLALVGESGCGKTSTVQTIMRMVSATSGSVVLDGEDITAASHRRMRPLRRRLQIVYQDPYEALDPRFRVRQTLEEPLLIHTKMSRTQRQDAVIAALETVGLTPAETFLERFPHELSGGQRQRVAIAAALILEPDVLIADEPVSMLDVSVRAGILDLLDRLRRERGLAILMITHDLATAARFADRIAVMYLGRIVEEGAAAEVVGQPRHPYTQALLSVVPERDPLRTRAPLLLVGEPPNAANVPPGCRFHPRCPMAEEQCVSVDPALRPLSAHHSAACVLVN